MEKDNDAWEENKQVISLVESRLEVMEKDNAWEESKQEEMA